MTDRPNGGGADTAVGPMPGYYPDPSIPGFVRYWGGTAWVPGTTRPAPAEGEVLEPPRFVGRHAPHLVPPTAAPPIPAPAAAAPGTTAPAAPATPDARPHGGPAGRSGGAADEGAMTGATTGATTAGPSRPGAADLPAQVPDAFRPTPPSLPDWPSAPLSASDTQTGPIYFDETSAGATFRMEPQAAVELRPRGDVAPVADGASALRPVPAAGVRPSAPPVETPPAADPSADAVASGPGVPPVAAGEGLPPAGLPAAHRVYGAAPEPPTDVQSAGQGGAAHTGQRNGWQADPAAQRGLLETGSAPRWVSWGVLPAAPDGAVVSGPGGAPPDSDPFAPSSFPAPAPVRAMRPRHGAEHAAQTPPSAANGAASVAVAAATQEQEPDSADAAATGRTETAATARAKAGAGTTASEPVEDAPAAVVDAAVDAVVREAVAEAPGRTGAGRGPAVVRGGEGGPEGVPTGRHRTGPRPTAGESAAARPEVPAPSPSPSSPSSTSAAVVQEPSTPVPAPAAPSGATASGTAGAPGRPAPAVRTGAGAGAGAETGPAAGTGAEQGGAGGGLRRPVRGPAPMPRPAGAAAPAATPQRTAAPAAARTSAPASTPAPVPPSGPSRGTRAAAGPAAKAGSKAGTRTAEAAPVQTAGLGRRLAARLVDTLVVAVVAVAAGVPLAASAVAHVQEKLDQARAASLVAGREVQVWVIDGVVLGKAGVLLGVLVVLGLLYEVLPTARTGQTFGKRVARIRVVDTVGGRSRRSAAGVADRQAPPFGRSLVRWMVRQVGVLLPFALLWPLTDRRARRGWHDRAARTRVVKA